MKSNIGNEGQRPETSLPLLEPLRESLQLTTQLLDSDLDARGRRLAERLQHSLNYTLGLLQESLNVQGCELDTDIRSTVRSVSAGRERRVLVVDDDTAFLVITQAVLEKEGLEVWRATSGEEALAVVAGKELPDLILLDARLGVGENSDGFEVCKALKQHPDGAHVPIIMVTSLRDPHAMVRSFEAGAVSFVSKPVNYAALVHRIRFHIRVAQEQLEYQRLLRALRTARLGYWHWAPGSGRFAASEQLLAMLGLDPEQGRCMSLQDFFLAVHPEDLELVKTAFQGAAKGRLNPVEYRVVRGETTLYLHQEWSQDGDSLLGVVQDITDQFQNELLIRKLAYSDELTGMASRSYFMRHLQESIQGAERHEEPLALLYLDLDSFKDINDTLGHDMGDKLLKTIARRLLKALRKSDFAARLGGDEFCVLLDRASSREAAEIAGRCLDAVNGPVNLGAQVVTPRISIGVAVYPDDGSDARTLLKAADSAMYDAKRSGKHRYAFYHPGLTHRAEKRLALEQDLRLALEQGQFMLHYQPQVSLDDGRVVGVEALIRWNHPEKGMIPPNEFIPAAERIGLIKSLGCWVLETACAQAIRWRMPGLKLAVNISPLHFRDSSIVEEVSGALDKTGWPAGQLELEVTESVVQKPDNLRDLKALGVGIAIDDFGTGYSSLASLRRLPIDTLKIDRYFIHGMAEDAQATTMVGTIVGLSRALGLTVVAEGVETLEEVQILAALQCELVQGYYFSRPVPPEGISELLHLDFRESRSHASSGSTAFLNRM